MTKLPVLVLSLSILQRPALTSHHHLINHTLLILSGLILHPPFDYLVILLYLWLSVISEACFFSQPPWIVAFKHPFICFGTAVPILLT